LPAFPDVGLIVKVVENRTANRLAAVSPTSVVSITM
jgi:hypothetical protein